MVWSNSEIENAILMEIEADNEEGCKADMDRSQQYKDGYRRASKDAVEWLQQRAASMNDPHARDILNAAAFGLGVDAKVSAQDLTEV